MYTQVTFGQFLDTVLGDVNSESGIHFDGSPNPTMAFIWREGEWLYEINNDFSVRVFRWHQPANEVLVAGPRWGDLTETREQFEPRFREDFKAAIQTLAAV